MDGMNRRAFLQGSGGVAALAAAGSASAALPSLPSLPSLHALPSATGVPVLFDARFPASRAHAQKLAGAQQPLQSVPGDATDLVQAFATGRGPRRLIGVTAESVPFCLSELSPRDRRPRLTLRRLDQDLFAWHLVHSS